MAFFFVFWSSEEAEEEEGEKKIRHTKKKARVFFVSLSLFCFTNTHIVSSVCLC